MKKQTINFSWPATLSNFSLDTSHENFSRAKLEVFYQGETADHRYFSQEFSEQLVKTLPFTPVVSYYDKDTDDFVGHATEQQILGLVDPTKEPTFEVKEDGNTWCVCDVVLYTERPDMVGELAKKVVGHSQSLELDPRTVKYVINYDEKKHFKNIEFTAGRFIGVSVLGKNQKPAFAGSEFFACVNNDTFETKMKLLQDYCNSNHDNGGQLKMNLNEFMELSWGEVSCKVNDALMAEYGNDAYVYMVDMYSEYAVARFYYYVGETKLMRVFYQLNDKGQVVLGNIEEVHVVYEPIQNNQNMENLDIEQIVSAEELDTSVEENVEDQVSANDLAAEVEEVVEEAPQQEVSFETVVAEETIEDEAQSSHVEEETPGEMRVENEEINTDGQSVVQETSGTASFTESERAEFENLKREEKITLVNSYKEDLDEAIISDFLDRIDSFEKSDLELELLKEYKRSKDDADNENKPMRAFAFIPVQNTNAETNNLDSFVRKNLRK